MSDNNNPWLQTINTDMPTKQAKPAPHRKWLPGAEIAAPTGLPVIPTTLSAPLWLTAAHGGAGVTSWARLLKAGDAGQAWPDPSEPINVLVVARVSHTGLAKARHVAMQWASGTLNHVALIGLLLSPDAPGRTPKQLKAEMQLTAGAYPHVIYAPWIESWRYTDAWAAPQTRDITKVIVQINRLVKEYAS